MKEILSKKRFRAETQALLVLYDLVILLAVSILMLVLYDGGEKLTWYEVLLELLLSSVCIFGVRYICKVYAQIWRYGGIQCYIRLLLSDGIAFLICYVLERIIPVMRHIAFARLLSVSCMSLLASLAVRMVYRYAYKCCRRDTKKGRLLNRVIRIFAFNRVELEDGIDTTKVPIAIVGAGRVGVSLAEELLENKSGTNVPRCFVDTDPEKVGREILGLPVIHEKDVTLLRTKYEVQEAVFALPQMDPEEKRRLYAFYKENGYQVKVYDYPTMQQVGEGKRHLREFDVEELLFRKPVLVNNDSTSAYYHDKVVLITGGGGSIGSELCRQIAKMGPKQLVVLDVYENGAYDVQQELRIAYGGKLRLQVEILSVCNRTALEQVFLRYHPNVVLHAAAHKHVPLMEHNCCEAVENNVFGTLNVVELSEQYGVERFMMVSTDKAVNPTNVMGATKRMCEMIVQCHSGTAQKTTFSATRFGNVLGSAGSVIPLFKRQIQNGGPVTVTDKRIIRYFMTIPEASQLVLQSGAMAKNGELFVLDMGKPVQILTLAENMIRLSGFVPYRDIEIVETGLRPGEKLYEELLVRTEELDKTDNSMIFVERDTPIPPEALAEKLHILRRAVETRDDEIVRKAMHYVVPTFRTPEEVNADAAKAAEMKAAENRG